jgi:hypothetical protein
VLDEQDLSTLCLSFFFGGLNLCQVEEPSLDADADLLAVFSAPPMRPQRKIQAMGAEQPGRQPLLPPGFQPTMPISAPPVVVPKERALGMKCGVVVCGGC